MSLMPYEHRPMSLQTWPQADRHHHHYNHYNHYRHHEHHHNNNNNRSSHSSRDATTAMTDHHHHPLAVASLMQQAMASEMQSMMGLASMMHGLLGTGLRGNRGLEMLLADDMKDSGVFGFAHASPVMAVTSQTVVASNMDGETVMTKSVRKTDGRNDVYATKSQYKNAAGVHKEAEERGINGRTRRVVKERFAGSDDFRDHEYWNNVLPEERQHFEQEWTSAAYSVPPEPIDQILQPPLMLRDRRREEPEPIDQYPPPPQSQSRQQQQRYVSRSVRNIQRPQQQQQHHQQQQYDRKQYKEKEVVRSSSTRQRPEPRAYQEDTTSRYTERSREVRSQPQPQQHQHQSAPQQARQPSQSKSSSSSSSTSVRQSTRHPNRFT